MKLLLIQTAFIGDVVLATAMIEKLKLFSKEMIVDIVVRRGNEGLLVNHPHINHCYVFDKKEKFKSLFGLLKIIRSQKYDYVVNAQRFFTTGVITAFSRGGIKIGFDKNPLSFLFDVVVKHEIGTNRSKHEIERNHLLIASITDSEPSKPKLYPSKSHYQNVAYYKIKPFICIAPTSVWYTKQFPKQKWIEFLDQLEESLQVYLLGAPSDVQACDDIIKGTKHKEILNLSGKLDLLSSAALMKDSKMNFVNDSAPMHLASAMNAPVCAVFCSTVPSFGFGPLSDRSYLIEEQLGLDCRPCGLHGHSSCPKGHFDCGYSVDVKKMLEIC